MASGKGSSLWAGLSNEILQGGRSLAFQRVHIPLAPVPAPTEAGVQAGDLPGRGGDLVQGLGGLAGGEDGLDAGGGAGQDGGGLGADGGGAAGLLGLVLLLPGGPVHVPHQRPGLGPETGLRDGIRPADPLLLCLLVLRG